MQVKAGQKRPHFNSMSLTGTALINVCIFSSPSPRTFIVCSLSITQITAIINYGGHITGVTFRLIFRPIMDKLRN